MSAASGDHESVRFRRLGAAMMFLGVALGAVAAHALKGQLEAAGRVGTWDTAVRYHLIHGLAIYVVALAPGSGRHFSNLCFAVGIVLFSGSLYALSLTGISWLGAITPFGGLAFLAGWIRLVFAR